MTVKWLVKPWSSISAAGLLLGTLFFAFSLTPTLLPRTFVTQGVLSGCALAAGYGIGVFGRWLWAYMQLPAASGRSLRFARLGAAAICVIVVIGSLWQAEKWQNSIRELMQLAPLETAHPLRVGGIALVTFTVLVALARLFYLIFRWVATKSGRLLPPRVAAVVGVFAAVFIFWLTISGGLFRLGLHLADSSYRQLDAVMEPEIRPPTDSLKTGSHASLLAWDTLGRAGREYIVSGPSRGEIAAVSQRSASEPIRVYVGLRSAGSPEARARLALDELKRVGGFDRSTLVVMTPTGTGWLDPAATDSLEYLHQGDVASVAVQYSYLASWLSLLVEPDYGADTARALFREIYRYWTDLPPQRRPKLYLHGLSLGAKNSEQSTDLFEVLADPFHGALWSGPPYSSPLWRRITAGRRPGSPAWLPQFRDGSLIRFANQAGVSIPAMDWGPMRIVYLQYASDPVTFFDYHYLYREPLWLTPPRGPDVSPQLRWFPVVTFLQLMLDMAMATTAPIGYGHVYAPAHYVDAWVEVTDVRDWSADDIRRLKQHLSAPRDRRASAHSSD